MKKNKTQKLKNTGYEYVPRVHFDLLFQVFQLKIFGFYGYKL